MVSNCSAGRGLGFSYSEKIQLLCYSLGLSLCLVGVLNLVLVGLSQPNSSACYFLSEGNRASFEACKHSLLSAYANTNISIENFLITPIELATAYFNIGSYSEYTSVAIVILLFVLSLGFYYFLSKKQIYFFNKRDFLFLSVYFFIMWFKGAVIDIDIMALSGELAYKGINPYTLAKFQSNMGLLPTFPYLPPCLLGFSLTASVTQLLDWLSVPIRNYSVLSVVIGFSYVILCKSLEAILSHIRPTANEKGYFWFLFLNPLGLYYVVVLTQLDILAVAIFVYAVRLYIEKPNSNGWIFFGVISLFFIKLQFITIFAIVILTQLLLSPIIDFSFSNFSKVIALGFGLLVLTFLYSLVPDCFESLAANPQAQRINWSTWWSYFGGGLQINRPIGFTIICLFSLVVFIGNKGVTSQQKAIITLFTVASFVGIFQASFAHTFGFTAFMVPALMIIPLFFKKHLFKQLFFFFTPVFLLCTWGTGITGQGIVLNMIGISSNFSWGAEVATKLFTLEYILHICFALLCLGFAYLISINRIKL